MEAAGTQSARPEACQPGRDADPVLLSEVLTRGSATTVDVVADKPSQRLTDRNPMQQTAKRFQATVALVCALTVSCSPSLDRRSTETTSNLATNPPTPSSSPDGSSDIDAPLLEDRPAQVLETLLAGSVREDSQVARAFSTLVGDCMESEGFEYRALPVYTETEIDKRSFFEANFGVGDREHAQTSGYEYSDSGNDEFYETPPSSSAEIAALEGTSDSPGCVETAAIALYGSLDLASDYDTTRYTIENLMVDIRSEYQSSEAYRILNGEWSECMAEEGYEYGSPAEPIVRDWPEPRPTEEERATAIADVGCQELTSYKERTADELAQLEEIAYEQNFNLISEFVEWREATLRNASGVLGE